MTLSPNHNDQRDWTIVQISDTHLMDQDDLEFVQMNPEQSFHAVMQHIQQQYPHIDAIVHTGDLAQVPVQETYARYLTFMQHFGTPFIKFRAIMTILIISRFIKIKIKFMPFILVNGALCCSIALCVTK